MKTTATLLMALCTALISNAINAASPATAPASYYREIRPLLAANCNACHKPDKMKAELDMTTFAALSKGGKHGKVIAPGNPDDSKLIEVTAGDDATMPKDADELKPAEVSLLVRWIQQGAKDDTPAPGSIAVAPPIYTAPPSITSLSFSPDGTLLAVAGYHEVLLHKSDGSSLIGRLIGECARVESIAFSPDGTQLAVAGGSPAEFGQVQLWDIATRKNLKTFQPSTDSLYGISFSPDGKTVACGAADRTVRRINLADGQILTEFKAHADWVLATCFTLDGKTIVSGGRDKQMKLIEVASGRFVDDINNPLEQVLCMSRHPKEDKVLYGGSLGGARIYKISDNQGRTAGRNDTNLLVTFERQRGPVNAVAFSADGNRVAIGSNGEVRLYNAANTAAMKPAAPVGLKPAPKQPKAQGMIQSNADLILSGFSGPVFAVAWNPSGTMVAAAGADGFVRLFDTKSGALIKQFIPVPIVGSASTSNEPIHQ